MNRLSLLLVILLACHLGGMAVIAQGDGKSSAQTHGKVGMVTRSFTDEKRQSSAARLRRRSLPPVTVAPDADISRESQKYPLVLLSHGTGGSAVQMMWLG